MPISLQATSDIAKHVCTLAASALATVMPASVTGDADTQSNGEPVTLHFHEFRSLKESKIRGSDGKEIAELENLVINRGDGQIVRMIVSRGGFAGIGEDEFAVAYENFGWDPVGNRFTLDFTLDEFRDADLVYHEAIDAPEKDTWLEEIRFGLGSAWAEVRQEWNDPFADGLGAAKRTELDGTIREIDRTISLNATEQVFITVETPEGERNEVVLGPAWFVTQKTSPDVGDEAQLKTLRLPEGEHKGLHLARSGEIRGERVRYRKRDGEPLWMENGYSRFTDPPERETPPMPLALATDLVGRTAYARGTEVGDVSDVIIERNSGEAAFLVVDADEVEGEAQGKRKLVPWRAASIGKTDRVRIHADIQTFAGAETLPDDITLLTDAAVLNPIYAVFELEPAAMDGDRRLRKENGRRSDGG